MNRDRVFQFLFASSAALLVAVFASAAPAQDDALTPWQVATMKGVTSATMSPDGAHVAYTIAIPRKPLEEDDGTSKGELHLLDVATGQSRPYVTAKSGARSVRWTPDGQHISFLTKRDDDSHTSLYLLPLYGGEATKVVELDERSVGSYEFSADGTRVVMIAGEPADKDQDKLKKKGFKQEIYEEEWRASQVWVAAADGSGEPRKLEVDGHVSAARWSPDGSKLALHVAPTSLVDDGYMRTRVWVLDSNSGEVHGKVENGGKLGMVEWSPDGTYLALICGFDINDGAPNRLMWAAVPTGGNTTAPQPWLGERERDEEYVKWLPDGRFVVLGSESVWTTLDLYSIQDDGSLSRDPLWPEGGPAATSVSFSATGQHAALVASTPHHPSEVYTMDLADGSLRRRTNLNPWLDDVNLAPQEVVRYTARDGLEIDGILIRPHDAGSGNRVPLIMAVHGGPEAHLKNGWLTRYAYPGQIGAARGIATFYSNYRGSTGRGLAYLKMSQGDPAGKEFDDVVDAVDHFINIGLADKDRIGVTGGSYGGYATAWMSTYYSDRFAAGVMFVGISDKISKVGTTDITDEEFYVHAMKRVWDDWQFFLERSPIYHADKHKTPLLILHGKDDPRVDPGQSREMYRHLKIRGQAPVRLVWYPGEGHGNRKAAARFDYNLRMMRWFEHYLKGDGGDAPAHPIEYQDHVGKSDEEVAAEMKGS